MNKRDPIIVVALVAGVIAAAIVVGGISLPFYGSPDRGGDNHDPIRSAEIDIAPGQFERSEGNVSMSINVVATIYDYGDPPQYDDLHFEDVMLCLYDRNGTVLHGENLGTISMRNRTEFAERYEVNVTLRTIPTYLLIDHPDFRNGSVVSTDLLEWAPERKTYTPREEGLGEIQDRFEFPRTNEPGGCG